MSETDDSPDGEPEAEIVDRFRAAIQQDAEKFKSALVALNGAIKRNGTDGDFSPISFFALARTLDYVALAEGQRRASKAMARRKANETETNESDQASGVVRRHWADIMTHYEGLRVAVGETGTELLASLDNADGLRAFCNLTTRRTGNHTPFFYSSLAVLLLYLLDKGELEDDRDLALLTPVGEQDFAIEVRALFDGMFRKLATGKNWNVEDAPGTAKFPTVRVGFEYRQGDLKAVEDYCRHFATDDSGWARFIVYRPARSDPTLLIKSFLAISAPRPANDGTAARKSEYRHFYWPPPGRQAGAIGGITSGVVLPLAEGIYLVGGRRELERPKLPPKTLQALALPRWAVEQLEPNIAAMGVSANRASHHLMSRGAIRATPIPRYQHKSEAGELYLGGLRIEDLADDLRRDAALESALEPMNLPAEEAWVRRFRLCAPEDSLGEEIEREAREILENCNNHPGPEGWGISPGWCVGKEELTPAAATRMLESAFKTVRLESAGKKGERFDFWSCSRFGALSNRN